MSGQWWESDLIVGPFANIAEANAWAAANPSSLFLGLLATISGVPCSWNGTGWGAAISAQRSIIIDTDWWTDCDDVGAMRIALWGEACGYYDIAGIILDANSGWGAQSIDALIRAEGHGSIPIGVHADASFGGSQTYQSAILAKFRPLVGAQGAVESAVRAYRRFIANAAGTIEILSLGYFTAMSALIDSPADDISSLTGLQLLNQRVSKIWAMAGNWPYGQENNFTRTTSSKNSAVNVLANYSGEIVFFGGEVGQPIITGDNLNGRTWDPVAVAYAAHGSASGRNSWDPITAYYAAIGLGDDFDLVRGTASFNLVTNYNSMAMSPNGRHGYVVATKSAEYYKNRLNAVLLPEAKYVNPAISTPKSQGLYAPTKYENALLVYDVGEATDIAASAKIYAISDRTLQTDSAWTSVDAERPVLDVSGSVRSAYFSGTKRLISPPIYFGSNYSVYVVMSTASNPGALGIFVSSEIPTLVDGIVKFRNFNIGRTATGLQAEIFLDGVATTLTATIGFVGNQSYCVSLVCNPLSATLYVDGVSVASTALAGVAAAKIPLILGNRTTATGLLDAFSGKIRKVRAYSIDHSSSEVAAISAEMLA